MLGPDVNLARVPWSGRVFETNGEDPFLSAALVSREVKGIQSNNISACVKHYLFNNHECNRETFSANVPERVGREQPSARLSFCCTPLSVKYVFQ